jgi:hypothetical protein
VAGLDGFNRLNHSGLRGLRDDRHYIFRLLFQIPEKKPQVLIMASRRKVIPECLGDGFV